MHLHFCGEYLFPATDTRTTPDREHGAPIGKIYRETKKGQGEHTGNQYTMERGNNFPLPKTAEKIGEQFNVSHQTGSPGGEAAAARPRAGRRLTRPGTLSVT